MPGAPGTAPGWQTACSLDKGAVVARWIRWCALTGLLASTLLFAAPAQAECGGHPDCIAVSLGDTRPAHGTPLVSAPLEFGELTAGTRSATQTIRVGAVAGPSGTRATLSAIVLGGTHSPDFAIDATTCTTGRPSLLHDGAPEAQLADTCTIAVSFRPTTAGLRSANVQVRTAAITRTIPLVGTGTRSSAGLVASPAALAVQLNTPATLDLAAFIEGNATGVTIVSPPAQGSVAVDGTRVTYIPARDYFGPDSFTYAAVNAAGSSEPAVVSVAVGGRPDPSRDPDVVSLLAAQWHAAKRFSNVQIANVQERLQGLRSGHGRTGDSGAALARRSAGTIASTGLTGTAAPQSAGASTGMWLAGSLAFGRREASGGSARRSFRTDGMTIGLDRQLDDDLLLGAAVGFAQDDTEVGTNGSTTRSRGHSLAVYGSMRPVDGLYLDALLGYGRLRHDSDRFVPAVGAFARSHGRGSEQLFGSITGGHMFERDGLLLSPYGRLDVAVHRFEQATETGAGASALTYFGHTQRAVQLAAGLRAESRHPTRFGLALPRVRLEFRHALEGGRDMALSFADQPGGPVYTLAPPRSDRTTVQLGVGSDFVFHHGFAMGLDYLLQRSAEGDRAYGIRAVLRKEFDGRAPAAMRETWQPLDSPMRVEAGYQWEDNLTRASAAADRLSDHVFSVGISQSSTMLLARHLRVVLTGFAEGDRAYRYHGLDRLSAGGRGELQYRSSGAFDAPTLALFARALHDEYNSRIRSGQRYTLGLSARQSWTDRIDAFAALSWNRRNARNEVFDGRDWGARVQFDYALNGGGVLYFGPEYRRGNAVSTTGRGTAQYAAIASASAPDDAFGRSGRVAWRLDARTVIWTIGYNLPLGSRDSLELTWRHARSTAFVPAAALYGGDAPRYRVNRYWLFYLLRF